jgi:hypothetical protein
LLASSPVSPGVSNVSAITSDVPIYGVLGSGAPIGSSVDRVPGLFSVEFRVVFWVVHSISLWGKWSVISFVFAADEVTVAIVTQAF